MKKILLVMALALYIFFNIEPQTYAQDKWTGNINFHFGAQTFSEEKWELDQDEDVGKQKLMGFDLDFGRKSWPINIDIGYFHLSDSSSFSNQYYSGKGEVSKNIFNFGIKKIWEAYTNLRPYLAGKLEYIISEQKIPFWGTSRQTITHKGLSLGCAGGLYWIFANHINLGIELGYSYGVRENFAMAGSENLDGSITKMSVFTGYHW